MSSSIWNRLPAFQGIVVFSFIVFFTLLNIVQLNLAWQSLEQSSNVFNVSDFSIVFILFGSEISVMYLSALYSKPNSEHKIKQTLPEWMNLFA